MLRIKNLLGKTYINIRIPSALGVIPKNSNSLLFYSKHNNNNNYHIFNSLSSSHFYSNSIFNFSNKLDKQQPDKIFKLTFSGLDKYTSMEDLNSKLSELSEIKVIRIHKLTNKNYGHADIISKLDSNLLKLKFESLKILGKSFKVRVREVIDESNETLLKKYTYLDYDKLTIFKEALSSPIKDEKLILSLKINCTKNIFEYVYSFYIKNLTDNPIAIKHLLSKFVGFKNENIKEFDKEKINFDCFGDQKIFDLINYEKEIFNYEFYINYDLNYKQTKDTEHKVINTNSRKSIGKDSFERMKNTFLIPIKSNLMQTEKEEEKIEEKEKELIINNNSLDNNESTDNIHFDVKYIEDENKSGLINNQIKRVNNILGKFVEIIKNLEYLSYAIIKNTPNGVYRNLNIKFNEKRIIMTIMISSAKITMIDLKIIIDALKYEFQHLSGILTIYISFNEKVIAETKTSNSFVKILGKEDCLKIFKKSKICKTNINNNESFKKTELRLYPFDDNENLSFLNALKIEDFFPSFSKNRIKTNITDESFAFKNIFDLTSNFTPYSFLMELQAENLVFFKSEYKFNLLNFDESIAKDDIKDLVSNKNSLEKIKGIFSIDDISGDCILQNKEKNFMNFNKIKIMKKNDLENDLIYKFRLKDDDLNNSLLVLNMKNLNLKLNKALKILRYQIIISNSFSQILDYLKNLSNPEYEIKDIKIRFFKEKNTDEKDIVLFVEIVKKEFN